MSFIDISKLSTRVKYEVERANLLSCKKILELPEFEFKKLCNLHTEDIKVIKKLAADTVLGSIFQRVNEVRLFDGSQRISLDCEILNSILDGGIPIRGITELAGESGAGKTQMCLQLSITVQYPLCHGGLGKGAVYICTEDQFPSNRLRQLFNHLPRSPEIKDAMGSTVLGDRIFVDHIADVDGLKQCLYHRLPNLLSRNDIGLIVIDSIAAVYRAEYSFRQSVSRAKEIKSVGVQLHKINKQFRVAVICINQVSDVMDGSDKVPALGLAWANIVTTRLKGHRHPHRALQVVSAPDLPPAVCFYEITGSGVHGLKHPKSIN